MHIPSSNQYPFSVSENSSEIIANDGTTSEEICFVAS